ncbi:optic atrophy 3 protein-domain-containing protein [Phaeosphaeria sp. MPI-PUGE-AT-0046c]|nr:optic atrophy 3 protein-domain-containing protein [Phaeosphaeria sp. MPI-PUGE-AT-0046c]
MSLTLKVTSLFVRTLAKPMANAIKRNAHEHPRFRRVCIKFAQGLHRIDMRMRLGLLQDPAVIDRQIKKEVQAAEAARQKAAMPTVKTEEEMKAEEEMSEKEREAIRKKAEERTKPRIRPLSEQKAIETGANFVAESFIFSVGIGVIVFEQWRQRRKARNARDDIREDLEDMQGELKAVKAELEELKARHSEPAPPGRLLGFWKGNVKSGEKADETVASKLSPITQASATDSHPTARLNEPKTVQEQGSIVDKEQRHE